jgi:hypothetical protein
MRHEEFARVVVRAGALFSLFAGCGDDGGGKAKGGGASQATLDPRGSECGSSTCTEQELRSYSDCIYDACGDKYEQCYGPDYQARKYSGPCGPYYTCLAKCGCSDTKCYLGCGAAPTDCGLCVENEIAYCVQDAACKQPACFGSAESSGKLYTCADLKKCCAAIPAGSTYRTLCDSEYNSSRQYGDSICNAFVSAFKTLEACP